MKDKEKLKIALQALDDIIDPIARIKRNMVPGYALDGPITIMVAQDFRYLTFIARTALGEIRWATKERK